MSQTSYKATITEHDAYYTTYTTWVSASSKNQAMVMAGALAGQEKARREFLRMGHGPVVEGLMAPDIKLEPVGADEFWQKQDLVEVRDDSKA